LFLKKKIAAKRQEKEGGFLRLRRKGKKKNLNACSLGRAEDNPKTALKNKPYARASPKTARSVESTKIIVDIKICCTFAHIYLTL